MNESIEVLQGVFYDPSKEWFQQPEELIELALQVEQSEPLEAEFETIEGKPENRRFVLGVWEHETSIGVFEMRVDAFYLHAIEHRAFLSKKANNKITLIKK